MSRAAVRSSFRLDYGGRRTLASSTPAAEEGTLTLFCGGDEELFQAAQPIFSSIAGQYFYLGGSGSGTAMKLVANTLLGVGMQAIAESVALGQKEGLDRHRLLEVLSHTAVIAPAHLGKLARADRGGYSPQFAIRLMNKDFSLVLETAAAARVPMPATAAAFQMNVAEFGEGKEEDFSAVITLMERLARLETSEAGNRRVAGYGIGLVQVLDIQAGVSFRISGGSSLLDTLIKSGKARRARSRGK